MFCYQCEQASNGKGCTKIGVCGKDPEVSALQDLLIYSLKGLALHAVAGRKVGVIDQDVNLFMSKALFSTLTNVDFDPKRFETLIRKSAELREKLGSKIRQSDGKTDFAHASASYKPESTLEGLVNQGKAVREHIPDAVVNPDVQSLQDIVLFGLKGVAAYADHAQILGKTDDAVHAFMSEALASMTGTDLGLNEWVGLALKCGEVNLRTMELLDAANTGTYGHPVPTKVPLGARKGKAILVSGHDLKDLDAILEQTEGKGSMSIPTAKCCPPTGILDSRNIRTSMGITERRGRTSTRNLHSFPGAILMTTNCIQKPLAFL